LAELLSEHDDAAAGEGQSTNEDRPFWKFIDAICSRSDAFDNALSSPSSADWASLNSYALEVGLATLPRSLHPLAEATLRSGQYIPATTFFQSMSSEYGVPCGEHGAFAVLPGAGGVVCALDAAAVSASPPAQHSHSHSHSKDSSWDHIYSSSANTAKSSSSVRKHVVLYGIPGSSSLCGMLGSAKALVQQGLLTSFSLRLAALGLPPVQPQQELQGYGVWLDIKNMEYKNVDDSSSNAAEASSKPADSEDEVRGRLDHDHICTIF
jgi:hypothetical protein